MSIDFSHDEFSADQALLTTSHTLEDENEFSLRPKTLKEYIGQGEGQGKSPGVY